LKQDLKNISEKFFCEQTDRLQNNYPTCAVHTQLFFEKICGKLFQKKYFRKFF